jgi:hypothetical protein
MHIVYTVVRRAKPRRFACYSPPSYNLNKTVQLLSLYFSSQSTTYNGAAFFLSPINLDSVIALSCTEAASLYASEERKDCLKWNENI